MSTYVYLPRARGSFDPENSRLTRAVMVALVMPSPGRLVTYIAIECGDIEIDDPKSVATSGKP